MAVARSSVLAGSPHQVGPRAGAGRRRSARATCRTSVASGRLLHELARRPIGPGDVAEIVEEDRHRLEPVAVAVDHGVASEATAAIRRPTSKLEYAIAGNLRDAQGCRRRGVMISPRAWPTALRCRVRWRERRTILTCVRGASPSPAGEPIGPAARPVDGGARIDPDAELVGRPRRRHQQHGPADRHGLDPLQLHPPGLREPGGRGRAGQAGAGPGAGLEAGQRPHLGVHAAPRRDASTTASRSTPTPCSSTSTGCSGRTSTSGASRTCPPAPRSRRSTRSSRAGRRSTTSPCASTPASRAPTLWDFIGREPLVPRAYTIKNGVEALNERPVGTGPWKLVEWKRKDRMRFERYERLLGHAAPGQAAALPGDPRGGRPHRRPAGGPGRAGRGGAARSTPACWRARTRRQGRVQPRRSSPAGSI